MPLHLTSWCAPWAKNSPKASTTYDELTYHLFFDNQLARSPKYTKLYPSGYLQRGTTSEQEVPWDLNKVCKATNQVGVRLMEAAPWRRKKHVQLNTSSKEGVYKGDRFVRDDRQFETLLHREDLLFQRWGLRGRPGGQMSLILIPVLRLNPTNHPLLWRVTFCWSKTYSGWSATGFFFMISREGKKGIKKSEKHEWYIFDWVVMFFEKKKLQPEKFRLVI